MRIERRGEARRGEIEVEARRAGAAQEKGRKRRRGFVGVRAGNAVGCSVCAARLPASSEKQASAFFFVALDFYGSTMEQQQQQQQHRQLDTNKAKTANRLAQPCWTILHAESRPLFLSLSLCPPLDLSLSLLLSHIARLPVSDCVLPFSLFLVKSRAPRKPTVRPLDRHT